MKPHRIRFWDGLCLVAGGRRVSLACLWMTVSLFLCAGIARAQLSTTGTGFMPGSRELFSFNFAAEPLGEFPKSVRLLSGNMEVVEKNGRRMLQASSRSEFLITMPERLPNKFTLEFDLITRAAGYNSDELVFEGTPTPNSSSASACVHWYQGAVTIQGGREPSGANARMPDDIAALIEGQMAEVRAEFDGDNFKLYTNGRRIIGFTDLKFVRGTVLRVQLGGMDTKDYAVHLARLRIADATTTIPETASISSPMLVKSATDANSGGGAVASSGGGGAASSGSTTSSGPAANLAITGLTVTRNANGTVSVRWNPLPVAATYFVVRWNAFDPACCNAMSLPGVPLTSPGWDDGVLPFPGIYVYRVIATTANGTLSAETRFTYGTAPTPPPGVAYPAGGGIIGTTSGPPLSERTPIPVATTPVNAVTTIDPTIAGTITPMPAPTTPTSGGTILTPTTTEPTLVTNTRPTLTPFPTTTSTTTTPSGSPTSSGADSGGGGGGGPADTTSGGPGAVVPTYRVMLTGFVAIRTTLDEDPFHRDGRNDEVFGAAAVVTWDRKANALRSFRFVNTRDYGDVGTLLPAPDRIQAGSATTKGGIVAGDKVPTGYDPASNSIPAPMSDRFPLLLWEGPLNAGTEMLVIAPSLWERDSDRGAFTNYKTNWENSSKVGVMNWPLVVAQLPLPNVTSGVVPVDPGAAIAKTFEQLFLGPITGTYKLVTGSLGVSADRLIGLSLVAPGVFNYQERMMVVTQEKLASMAVGQGVTLQIPFVEPMDPTLGAMYTLYLRVQRTL